MAEFLSRGEICAAKCFKRITVENILPEVKNRNRARVK
jgi:hypothetical protein